MTNDKSHLAIGGLLTLLLLTPAAFAQDRFDHWTTENGLPHSGIKGLWQTRDGYLWLTTGQGVARFDGVRFKVFNRHNTPALTSDRLSHHTLWEDRAGNLWMGTEDGGAIKYRDGDFTAYTTAQGLPGNAVVRIDEDAAGVVWITTSAGLARWQNGQLTRVAPAPGSPFNDYLTAPKNMGVDGRYCGLWRRDAAGWQRFAYGKWEPFPLPPHLKDPAKLQIRSIVEDAQRRVWYSLWDQQSEYYRVSDGRLRTFNGFTANQFICYQDRQERLWVSDQEGQSALWKDGQITSLKDFSTAYVFNVLEDRAGTLWIGTKGGLARLTGGVFTILGEMPGEAGGISRGHISALYEDAAGVVWVGASEGVLYRLAAGSGGMKITRCPIGEVLGYNTISKILEDDQGFFWLGSSRGIYRIRRQELDDFAAAKVSVIAPTRFGKDALWQRGWTDQHRL